MADEIGYFPQMIISSIAATVLLLILAVREFDIIGFQAEVQQKCDTYSSSAYTHPLLRDRSHPVRMFTGLSRDNPFGFRISSNWCLSPPRTPNPESRPAEVANWERHRMGRHLAGHFVFPPITAQRSQTSSQSTATPFHKKTMTMTRIMEGSYKDVND